MFNDQNITSFPFNFGNQNNQLEIIFDRLPIGMAIIDRDFRIQNYNPTWGDFAARYAPPGGVPLAPGVSYFDHLPGAEDTVLPLFKRALQGETIRQNGVRLESEKIITYWDIVLSPLVTAGEIVGLLNVAVDASERVNIQQTLEQRVEDRTQELNRRRVIAESLGDIITVLNSGHSLQEALVFITERASEVIGSQACLIHQIQEDQGIVVLEASYGLPDDLEKMAGFPLYSSGNANQRVLSGKPVWGSVLEGKPAPPDADQTGQQPDLRTWQRRIAELYHAWLAVPLIVQGQVYGSLEFYFDSPRTIAEEEINLAQSFADQTALGIDNARLYSDSERRAEESETLFAVQQAITSKLEMDEIMQMIADESRRLTETDISAVYLLDKNELEIAYVSGNLPQSILGYRLSIEDSIAGRVIQSRKAILVEDTWDDPRVDRTASDQVQARSLLIVPLMFDFETIGTITVANHSPGGFNPEVEKLLTKFAANVVISLENARLYRAESDRREVAESLRDTLTVLNSKRPLKEILEHISAQAVRIMGASTAVVYYLQPESTTLSIQAGYQIPQALLELGSIQLYEGGAVQSMFNHKPYVIHDIQAHLEGLDSELSPSSSNFQRWLQILKENFKAYLGMPLLVDGEIYGSLGLYYPESEDFSEEQIELGLALVNQAVLAIENARLVERAEIAAVASERNRLARDLHDAVTQTLFAASMIADVLPKIWSQDPDDGFRRLDELRQLTRGALSEMRTLLVELRPAALIDTDLSDLIEHQVNAFIARTRFKVEYLPQSTGTPPVEIKEVCYRIAQEALNNIAKHTSGTSVRLQLRSAQNQVELLVEDDGSGFDHESALREGLGLGIMQERARNVGADFEIDSQIGRGTLVRFFWDSQQN